MSPLVLVALAINVLVVGGLAYGLSRRREAAIHMKIMTTCFVVDLLNVILVEVTARVTNEESQGAVEQGFLERPGLAPEFSYRRLCDLYRLLHHRHPGRAQALSYR